MLQVEDAQLQTLTGRIKQAALEVGFDLVGITPAQPLPHAEERLTAAVNDGLLAPFDWFDLDRARVAADPREMMPGLAVSVISVGLCYLTKDSVDASTMLGGLPAAPTTAEGTQSPRGRVAKYALGEDYHTIFKRKMRLLLERIRALLAEFAIVHNLDARLLTDTARVADRAVAAEAGLGWYGKNTNILTKHYGSWVLLGEVVLSLPLAYDAPIPRDCGSCELCLHACPTAALSPDDPYRLRADQCISYLTIEHRGSIPRDLRPLMGDNVFGCDICQDVCPHNQRVGTRLPEGEGHPEFRATVIEARPELIPLLKLDEATFRRRFAGKPVRRAKREGMARNAAIALGNSGNPAALPSLIETMQQDESAVVREHAAWAVGRLGGTAAVAALHERLLFEPDEVVRKEIAMSLHELALPQLEELVG